jgi:hypothetical protein
MGMGFGTWKVRSLYRVGSLKTVATELAKYNLDLVAVQEVTWVMGGSQPPEDIHFSMELEMLIITYGQAFLYIRKLYQQLRV